MLTIILFYDKVKKSQQKEFCNEKLSRVASLDMRWRWNRRRRNQVGLGPRELPGRRPRRPRHQLKLTITR